jgi:hypothetical protein
MAAQRAFFQSQSAGKIGPIGLRRAILKARVDDDIRSPVLSVVTNLPGLGVVKNMFLPARHQQQGQSMADLPDVGQAMPLAHSLGCDII